MIVCTMSADSIVRGAFGRRRIFTTNLNDIINTVVLDPRVSKIEKEAYVVTASDLKSAESKQKFLEAVSHKHPASVVVVVDNEGGRVELTAENGIDAVIQKPRRANDVIKPIEGLIAKSKEKIIETVVAAEEHIEKWTPTPETDKEDKVEDQRVEQLQDVKAETLDVGEEKEPQFVGPEEPETENLSLIQRVKECDQVAEVTQIVKEIHAAKLMKEIAEDNAKYASIEATIKGLSDKIRSILMDTSTATLTERINKCRAILRDKDYYKTKTNSIIEQYFEELVETILATMLKHVNAKTEELDKTIMEVRIAGKVVNDTPCMAALLDSRANLWLELAALDKNVREICKSVDGLAQELVDDAVVDDVDVTGLPAIDQRLKVYGEAVKPVTTLNMVANVLRTADKASVEFEKALDAIDTLSSKLKVLLGEDNAVISAMLQEYEQMKATRAEDLVVANTRIKKATRIFVGEPNSGITAVPLILAQIKARTSSALILDLTGRARFEDYGESIFSLYDFVQGNVPDDRMRIVSGKQSDSPESIQRLLNVLNRAADFYGYIMVITTPDQKELIENLQQDACSINYIVGTSNTNISFMRDFIKETKYRNVGQRVILNKCDVAIESIVERLGIMDDVGVSLVRIPYLPEIVDASYHALPPYMIESVVKEFQSVKM